MAAPKGQASTAATAQGEIMSIPQKIADDLMVKCGRRCCICRRFEPLHLQVHHIKEQSEGGTDDPDNLIVTCLTCHSDIHTHTKLTRRFTGAELKAHRDELIKSVAQSTLPQEADVTSDYEQLTSTIVSTLLDGSPPATMEDYSLSPDAVDLLLRAVTDKGMIHDTSDIVSFSTSVEEAREMARIKSALEELEGYGLIRRSQGILYLVTHSGFLLADKILAAGAEGNLTSS